MIKEVADLLKYVKSESSERANDHLIFPLFRKVFFKDSFKKENDASGADIYIEGRIIVELKTNHDDWCSGFFQALHYQKKSLNFSSVCVISHNFIGLWKLNDIPDFAIDLYKKAEAVKAASEVGIKNSKSVNIGQKKEILGKALFLLDRDSIEQNELYINAELSEFVDTLQNLDSVRQQINHQNFINKIELLKKFFDTPMDAVHCFYAIVSYWDITSTVREAKPSKPNFLEVIGRNGKQGSEEVEINPRFHKEFIKFIESHYVFTNEEAGISIDYYFSRFDEVLSKVDPEYVKQHGIFFTDINLSKFALWFVHYYQEKKLAEKYIVFDPAGGSGNLVTSWRKNHLKHKIVSELQPDLLKTIERRMKQDEMHIQSGFTIIPKTSENRGLNFIDKSALEYLAEIERVLNEKNLKLDKPIAYLLNPPYKNTDENEEKRIGKEAEYLTHPTIIDFTGEDAAKERYLAFLAQIINLSETQIAKNPDLKPMILIFTPTSWLIPRPAYKEFREKFDKYFKYENGFVVTSYEFFKLSGRFPISFTIWSYNYTAKGNKNIIKLNDYTGLKSEELNINWNIPFEELDKKVLKVLKGSKKVLFNNSRGDIRDTIPEILNSRTNQNERQQMYDFKRSPTKTELESKSIFGGLPLKDNRRGNIKTYGSHDGQFIGMMDDGTPTRVNQDKYNRMSNLSDRVWFRLDNDLKSCNKTRLTNSPTDKYSYCAYDLKSAHSLFSWFALTKAINGRYPIWANQFDIWASQIPKTREKYFYSLCFAFGLSENRCIVTKFEKDNPVKGVPEVYVDNPLCPTNPESFWSTTLASSIDSKCKNAHELISLITELYKVWNLEYCKGSKIENVGLDKESYFKFFEYSDFVTPYSGLIQIEKYAEIHNAEKLLSIFKNIIDKTKNVKEEIYQLIVNEFKYFD
ncbi:MAG: hypothetical protein IPL26_13905 [Leptospiraceae bacterium]|nr:hypothetical protein [Leptospiraceae bacterium]